MCYAKCGYKNVQKSKIVVVGNAQKKSDKLRFWVQQKICFSSIVKNLGSVLLSQPFRTGTFSKNLKNLLSCQRYTKCGWLSKKNDIYIGLSKQTSSTQKIKKVQKNSTKIFMMLCARLCVTNTIIFRIQTDAFKTSGRRFLWIFFGRHECGSKDHITSIWKFLFYWRRI